VKSIALITILLLMAICLIGCGEEAVEEVVPAEEISNDEEAVEEDPPDETEAEPEPADEAIIKGEDEQVTIIIDEIKMTDQIPPDILEIFNSSPLVLSEGHTFVSIYFTIPRIDEIYIRTPEGFPLYDEDGVQYQPEGYQISGIKFTDPTDIRAPVYLAAGGTGKVLYHIPEQIELALFVFEYKYSMVADGEIEGSKQLEVPLGN